MSPSPERAVPRVSPEHEHGVGARFYNWLNTILGRADVDRLYDPLCKQIAEMRAGDAAELRDARAVIQAWTPVVRDAVAVIAWLKTFGMTMTPREKPWKDFTKSVAALPAEMRPATEEPA